MEEVVYESALDVLDVNSMKIMQTYEYLKTIYLYTTYYKGYIHFVYSPIWYTLPYIYIYIYSDWYYKEGLPVGYYFSKIRR